MRFVIVIIILLLSVSLAGIVTSATKGIILQMIVTMTNSVIFVSEGIITHRSVSLERAHQGTETILQIFKENNRMVFLTFRILPFV